VRTNTVLRGSFLGGLPPELIAELSRRGRRRMHQRGSVLCAEGEMSRWLLVVISGHVKVTSWVGDGSEVLLDIRGPGALIGELEATDGKPRPASVTALEPVETLVVAYEVFADFVRSHDEALRLLLETLCERLREADRKRIEFSALDATERVVTRLLELADWHGTPVEQGVSISLALTQEELAGWAGVSREAVSKALAALRRHGWIETGRRTVTIRNIAELRRLTMARAPARGELPSGPALWHVAPAALPPVCGCGCA
jgi:CRP/FNR family transcriptional regulator, cyclic AMP receptor protein